MHFVSSNVNITLMHLCFSFLMTAVSLDLFKSLVFVMAVFKRLPSSCMSNTKRERKEDVLHCQQQKIAFYWFEMCVFRLYLWSYKFILGCINKCETSELGQELLIMLRCQVPQPQCGVFLLNIQCVVVVWSCVKSKLACFFNQTILQGS